MLTVRPGPGPRSVAVTAYRTPRPDGISAGTWALILGELGCFLGCGLHESDPRLTALGCTGVTASTLMLARVVQTRRRRGPHPMMSRRPGRLPEGAGARPAAGRREVP
jgi:hypothetical protein